MNKITFLSYSFPRLLSTLSVPLHKLEGLERSEDFVKKLEPLNKREYYLSEEKFLKKKNISIESERFEKIYSTYKAVYLNTQTMRKERISGMFSTKEMQDDS